MLVGLNKLFDGVLFLLKVENVTICVQLLFQDVRIRAMIPTAV